MSDFLGLLKTPEDLMAAKLALDLLVEEAQRAPEDAEHIYNAFSVQLGSPQNYRQFQHHYLHAYLLKNYTQIEVWLQTLELDDSYPMRLKFWRMAARLIYQDAIDNSIAPTLSTMIRGLGFLPSIIQRAFPAIQNPLIKAKFKESL